MKSDPRCTPCLVRQLERSARAMHLPQEEFDALIARARESIPRIPLSLPPNIYSTKLLELIYQNGADPYRDEKKKHNQEVKSILPIVKKMIKHSEDPRKSALLAACLGNVIDLGTIESSAINPRDIKKFLETAQFVKDDSEELLDRINDAKKLVYVTDNAGEVLLDRLCTEFLGVKNTLFIAKEGPILNDVTRSELIDLGFPAGQVLSTGTNHLGINWETLNPEVRNAMQEADVVIAKGHANFESFIDGPQEAFLILKIKCDVVAAIVKEPCGSLVCMRYLPSE